MNEESVTKNVLIIVLILIIVGLFFSIIDITKNEGAVVESVVEAVVPGGGEDSLLDEEEAAPVAEKVYTPKPKPAPVVKPAPVSLDPSVVIVTYTDSGFIPPVVEVTAGGSVTFINSSSKPLWVTSENHPTAKAQIYRGFDQGKSVPSGGTYIFNFTQVGVWGYKNLNLGDHLGAVSVVEQ